MLHTLYKAEPLKTEDLAPIKSSLESLYSRSQGWRLFNRYNWSAKSHDFILQNDELDGKPQRVIVSVHLDTTVTQSDYDNLKSLGKRLSHGAGEILKKILVFSDSAAFSAVPADIEMITIGELLKAKIRATEPKLVA